VQALGTNLWTTMAHELWGWIAFGIIVLVMLIIDLGLFQRKPHVISLREATIWSIVWVVLALLFNVGVWYWMGTTRALEYLTAYLIEKSLSVDNLFVFVMIFAYFRITPMFQPRVLKWGIVGALVMRAIMLFAGLELIRKFHWMVYVFGGILLVTSVRLLMEKDRDIDPEKNPVLRLFRRVFPVTSKLDGEHFFTRVNGRWCATPLFVALIAIETTDLIFALDSIPAVLAVSRDPLIVYSSNIFAILGLRALYFVLAGVLQMFVYLHYGISLILFFVGVKMILSVHYPIPTEISLGIVFVIIVLSVLASVWFPKPAQYDRLRPRMDNLEDFARWYRRLSRDPRLRRWVRVLLWLAAVYVVSPLDLIPDFIPRIGRKDDLWLTAAVLFLVLNRIPESILRDVPPPVGERLSGSAFNP